MKTKDEYEQLSGEEQLEYITEILGIKNGKVGGKVRATAKSTGGEILFVVPYDFQGNPVRLFRDLPDGIPARVSSEKNSILQNDYVQGDLGIHMRFRKEEVQLFNVKKMQSFEELKKGLFDSLKEIWQREGFVFGEKEIAKFDGEMKFGEWVSEEVAYKLKANYENFIREKMEEQEKELHALQEGIHRLEVRRQEAQEALTYLEKENKEAKKEYQHYIDLGIFSEKKEKPDEREMYHYATYGQLAKDVWSYLWKEKNLYYEKSTVEQFLNALRTRQLILLWGRPGTGKTSLPRGVAEALGATCVRVQVQSNWTDNQDLLGFYNIVDKRYISTQFLDALVEAREDSERLYLILLDEMNLSNVEYYFSEMLNVFTWEEDKAYTLHLYSRKLWENAQKEQKELEAQQKDFSHLVDILADMADYPPKFSIPNNVRFVGTLNADATTKTISPKVIDRSALIELETISKETKRREKEALPDTVALNGKLQVPACRFEVQKLPPQEVNPIKPILEEIRELLKEAGLSVSNRLDSYADQWLGWEDNRVTVDEIVLEKILPILDMEYTGKKKEALKRLKDEILEKHDCKKSLAKLKAMEEQVKDDNRIRYWEN